MAGWIKLHRQLMDSKVWAKPELLKVWMYCLLRACHKTQHVEVKTGKSTTIVTLQPGELLWGRIQGGKDLKFAPSTAERYIKRLGDYKMISRKTFTHYSILKVCKWSDYQEITKESEQPMNNQRTTNGQPMNTYKNANNVNKEEKETPPPFKFALWGQIKQEVEKTFGIHTTDADTKHYNNIAYNIRESIKTAKKQKGQLPSTNDTECITIIKLILSKWPEWAKDRTPSYFDYHFTSLLSNARNNRSNPNSKSYKKL